MTTKKLTIEEKREKIRSNYETIEVLRAKLNEATARERTGMTRAAYIKMIFDVTKKVAKQNDELARAKQDTRKLQRDISNLTSRLERNFSLVEKTILKVRSSVKYTYTMLVRFGFVLRLFVATHHVAR